MKKKIDKICSQMFSEEDFDITRESIDELDKEGINVIVCRKKECQMKLLSYEKIPLSKIVPILGDFGFITISEITYTLEFSDKEVFVTKILIDAKGEGLLVAHENNIKEILIKALKGEMVSSPIFGLVYYEDFNYRELMLFRSLIIYINELVAELSIRPIELCLVRYHRVSKALLDFFHKSFDPALKSRELELTIIQQKVLDEMKLVEGINDDRVVKLFFEVLNSIIRTNYFLDKDTISYKLDLSSLKSHLRGIQPSIEMSVYGSDFAGVHLRRSKVARGGIRWSNRREGFRDEIKSLMATQEAKNAVIVPAGAKGGFTIFKESVNREEFEAVYERYIDSLLDLVDNPPSLQPMVEQIVKKDGEDSYFVVAADRGTASMSDTANRIAQKRGFWLGDAFASGSSSGYHHKRLGVTAKGALEATRRFFLEMGRDLYSDVITIVGVGSMSGDVFGNGMLKSKNFKLLGAVSHDEVFIDPNPDLEVAYAERKRLFGLKRAKWSSYDPTKISEGGGVFKRNAKAIKLSPQIKEMLGVDREFMSGEELANNLLKTEVDMLYFGGIGTYVKASWQSNISLGDKENEFVRVDADKVRAKTICEGANLALTMEARIEYAINGGRINLDSIDNAAGVNTSDHEVNFKILLHSVMQDGAIDEKQRVELIKSQSDFVLQRVLQTNHRQSLSISLDEIRSQKDMDRFKRAITVLEQNLEEFKRSYFSIPKEHNFSEIVDSSGSIVRPVLATLTLYAKIFLERFLVKRDVLDRTFFERYLLWYFPDAYVERFREYILSHSLKKQIIAMVVANKIIDQAGVTFISDFNGDEGEHFMEKIQGYLQEELLKGMDKKREKIYAKDGSEDIYRLYGKLLEIEEELV